MVYVTILTFYTIRLEARRSFGSYVCYFKYRDRSRKRWGLQLSNLHAFNNEIKIYFRFGNLLTILTYDLVIPYFKSLITVNKVTKDYTNPTFVKTYYS